MKNPKVTTSIYLEKRFGQKKDGTFSVKLRLNYKDERRYYSIKKIPLENFDPLELNIDSVYFDKTSFTIEQFEKITGSKPGGLNKEYRKFFNAIEQSADKVIKTIIPFTFDEFKQKYFKKQSTSDKLKDLYADKINTLLEKKRIGTASSYNLSLKSIILYCNNPNVTVKQITVYFLEKYEEWMLSEKRSYTTIGIYLRNLRHIINVALEKELISSKQYPFKKKNNEKYEIPTGENIKKALTLQEIKLIFNYDASSNVMEQNAKDYWLLSYICNGMNMADIVHLKYENMKGNKFEFYRRKTINTVKKKKKIIAIITDEAKEIIQRLKYEPSKSNNYIFPIISEKMTPEVQHRKIKQHIRNINRHIGAIAAKLGIEKEITTYFARHSFSTISRNIGASTEYISEQLGHQDLKTTQNYLDSFQDEIKEKFSKMLTDFSDE